MKHNRIPHKNIDLFSVCTLKWGLYAGFLRGLFYPIDGEIPPQHWVYIVDTENMNDVGEHRLQQCVLSSGFAYSTRGWGIFLKLSVGEVILIVQVYF